MNWVTAATFDSPAAAELAKNMLESHGLTVMLSDEVMVATFWSLSNAVGGIKLRVLAEQLGRAEYLLDHKTAPLATDEAIADAVAADPQIAEQFSAPVEPFDDTPTDIEVDRVLKGTVFALLFPPAQLYTLCRLWMLRYADPPVRDRDRWKVRLAYALSLPLWFVIIVPAVFILAQFDSQGGAGWRNQRFGDIGDVALTVDLPSDFGYAIKENEPTVLGPVKARYYSAQSNGQTCFVTILRLDPADTPADPKAAARLLVEKRNAGPGFIVDSLQPATLGGYPGAEIAVRYRDRLTQKMYAVRERVLVVDRNIVILTTEVPEEDSDSRLVRRFFRSAKIE